MSIAAINLAGNTPDLPEVNAEPEKETEEPEKIVFVKPHEDGFCFVSTHSSGGRIYIDHAGITDSPESGTERISNYCRENRIKHVRYDCSVFIHEGKAIREALPDTYVTLYKPGQNLIDRITAHLGFVKSKNFIFRKTKPEEYQKFVSLMEQFNATLTYEYRNEARLPKEAYNIAMDILSDIAKYYRRNLLYR